MSNLVAGRPTLVLSKRKMQTASEATGLWLLMQSLTRNGRKRLLHGALGNERTGEYCALGWYFKDRPANASVGISTPLCNEVAFINDLNPKETPQQRYKRVKSWLKFRMKTLEGVRIK